MAEGVKKTKGKQKIEIKPIESPENRMITFAKRKSGIYKKANELTVLTGAEVGVIIFSPTGKPYSFAHPSMEAITSRFRGKNPAENENNADPEREARIEYLTNRYNDLVRELNAEKEREKILREQSIKKDKQDWWEAPVDQLSKEELEHMDKNIDSLMEKLMFEITKENQGGPPTNCPPQDPSQMQN